MNKKCSSCGECKSVCDFHKNKRKKDGLNSICKKCRKEKGKVNYINDPEKYKNAARRSNKKAESATRKYIWNFLKNNPCKHCDEKKPELLEFDHLHDKKFNISHAIRYSSTMTVIDEIKKCQVLCGNCHRIKTHKENDTWKYQMYKKENPTLDV